MVLNPTVIQATIVEIEDAFSGLDPPGDAQLLHPQCMDDGDIADSRSGRISHRGI
jgi:hypothetical protein